MRWEQEWAPWQRILGLVFGHSNEALGWLEVWEYMDDLFLALEEDWEVEPPPWAAKSFWASNPMDLGAAGGGPRQVVGETHHLASRDPAWGA